MTPAPAQAPRVPRRAALAALTPVAIGAILDPHRLAVSDDGLRHRWERIALGGRS